MYTKTNTYGRLTALYVVPQSDQYFCGQ